jgi:hypothetical protein
MIDVNKTYRTKDGHEVADLGLWFDGDLWGKIMPKPDEQRPPIFTAWHPDGVCRAFQRPEWELVEIGCEEGKGL